jgi:RNA polymerase sigma-70 factor (ECF subfamily)
MPRPDDELLAGLAAGREDAFRAAYERFAPRLLAVACGILGTQHDAEDAVQDLFLSLVKSRPTLGRVENLPAYLFASLRHAAARRIARQRIMPQLIDPLAAAAPAKSEIPAEQSARLEQALASLPPEQREVIALKVDGGLKFHEIAAVLGTSPNTAASRYRYALEKLRERMK